MRLACKSLAAEKGGKRRQHEGPYHPSKGANQNPDQGALVLDVQVGHSQPEGKQVQHLLPNAAEADPLGGHAWPYSASTINQLSIGRKLEGILPVQVRASLAGEGFNVCTVDRALHDRSWICHLPRFLELPVTRGPVVSFCALTPRHNVKGRRPDCDLLDSRRFL